MLLWSNNEDQMRFIQQKRDLSPSPIHCKSLCHCSLMETKSRILRLLLPRNITQCPHHYHQISDITWKIIEKKCSGWYLSFQFLLSPNDHFDVNYILYNSLEVSPKLNPEVSRRAQCLPRLSIWRHCHYWTMMGIQWVRLAHLTLSPISPRNTNNTSITNGS